MLTLSIFFIDVLEVGLCVYSVFSYAGKVANMDIFLNFLSDLVHICKQNW